MDSEKHSHKSWNVTARDGDGQDVGLRLAIEQSGHRGYAAYAYLDRGVENEDEMILTTEEHASSGPEAFRALRKKLESERGLTLEDSEAPNWLMDSGWQDVRTRPADFPDRGEE